MFRIQLQYEYYDSRMERTGVKGLGFRVMETWTLALDVIPGGTGK
jgi:hypothetical protein